MKLGDVCEIISGSTPKTSIDSYWNGELCWITPAEITDNDIYIEDTERKITAEGAQSCSLSLMPIGTVLLSSRAPIGKVAITAKEMYCNQGFKNLICSNSIFNKYLFWFLKHNNDYLNSLGRGATFKEISKKIVANIEIPLPPLETQKQIAANLDKATQTIDLCNAILEKLDLLVKARFVEMFGDITLNPNNYPLQALDIHIDLLSGFPFDSTQYVENGVNICGGLIIMPQSINWDECKHWKSISGYEQYLLKKNDIVMALDRPWISNGFKVAKVDTEHLPALLIQRTARIRGKDINQEYLYHCFINCGFDRHCNVTGSLVPHISAKDIRSFQIMIPSLDLQEQFAAFVEKSDRTKAAVKQVLAKAETLKKALMQEYFG